jgi:hypothetical protein
MATLNPFELLGADDNDDPTQLIAAAAAAAQKAEAKKSAVAPAGKAAQPAATTKFPTKPAPPSQTGELWLFTVLDLALRALPLAAFEMLLGAYFWFFLSTRITLVVNFDDVSYKITSFPLLQSGFYLSSGLSSYQMVFIASISWKHEYSFGPIVLYIFFQFGMHAAVAHQLVEALAVVNVAVAEVDGDMVRTVASVVTMAMSSREVMVAEAMGMVL